MKRFIPVVGYDNRAGETDGAAQDRAPVTNQAVPGGQRIPSRAECDILAEPATVYPDLWGNGTACSTGCQ